MANQETVIGLLYFVKDSIKLEITEYEWPKDYKLNYFDFAVSFESLGHKFIGRGVDKLQSIAIEKAASEALEKLISYTNKIDTVGLSVGVSYDCDEHAKFEASERYYLNEHVNKNINLTQHNFLSSDFINIFVKNNSDVKIDFLKMLTPKEYFGIICILKKGSSRSIGFSYSRDEGSACEKSFLEALPNLAWAVHNDSSSIEKPWHLKVEYINKIESLVRNNSQLELNLIARPELEKLNINLDENFFLKGSKVQVTKYVVKSSAE